MYSERHTCLFGVFSPAHPSHETCSRPTSGDRVDPLDAIHGRIEDVMAVIWTDSSSEVGKAVQLVTQCCQTL